MVRNGAMVREEDFMASRTLHSALSEEFSHDCILYTKRVWVSDSLWKWSLPHGSIGSWDLSVPGGGHL